MCEREREMDRVLYVSVKEENSACLCERERRTVCVCVEVRIVGMCE